MRGGVAAQHHVRIGDALPVVDRRRPGREESPDQHQPRHGHEDHRPAPASAHSNQPPARSATTWATAGANTPRLTIAEPSEEQAGGEIERQRTDAVERQVQRREQQRGRDERAAIAPPRSERVEQRSAHRDLLGNRHTGDDRCPEHEARIEGGDVEPGRTVRDQPGGHQRAASGRPERCRPDTRSPRTPPGGKRDREQRHREHDPRRHRRRRIGRADGGSKCRGGHDPGEAERRARCSSGANRRPIGLGDECPRRRRYYLAGPGAARAGATSGRSG